MIKGIGWTPFQGIYVSQHAELNTDDENAYIIRRLLDAERRIYDAARWLWDEHDQRCYDLYINKHYDPDSLTEVESIVRVIIGTIDEFRSNDASLKALYAERRRSRGRANGRKKTARKVMSAIKRVSDALS